MEKEIHGEQPGEAKPRLSFRKLETHDLELLADWIKLPHVAEWWGPESSLAKAAIKQRYHSYICAGTVYPFVIVLGGQPIGYIQFYGATKADHNGWQEPEGSYGVDLFIGEIKSLGLGHGTNIVKQFIDYLFIEKQAKLIIIDPDPNNLRAIRCYEKAGFTRIGLRETIEGTHLLMELTRDEWKHLQKST